MLLVCPLRSCAPPAPMMAGRITAPDLDPLSAGNTLPAPSEGVHCQNNAGRCCSPPRRLSSTNFGEQSRRPPPASAPTQFHSNWHTGDITVRLRRPPSQREPVRIGMEQDPVALTPSVRVARCWSGGIRQLFGSRSWLDCDLSIASRTTRPHTRGRSHSQIVRKLVTAGDGGDHTQLSISTFPTPPET